MALTDEFIKISGLNLFNQTLPPNRAEIITNVDNTTYRTSISNIKELSELSVNTSLRSQTLNVTSTIQTNSLNAQNAIVGTSLIVGEAGTLQAFQASIANLTVSNDIVGNLQGSISGNSQTTTALQTPRNFILTGAINGNTLSNLTDDVTLNTVINAGVITNVQIAENAEILGTKIVPNFGIQDVSFTGNITFGNLVGKTLIQYSSLNNRVYTLPDVEENASFVMTSGDQTIGGVKQFSSGRIDSVGASSHSHGSISIGGAKNSFAGIAFPAANAVFMVRDTDSMSGIYRNNNTWLWQFDGTGTLITGTIPWSRLTGIPSTLAATVNTSGNQTIAGTKTFSGTVNVGSPSLANNLNTGAQILNSGSVRISSNDTMYIRHTLATSATWRTVLLFRDKTNTNRGSIQVNNANTRYNTSSDYRLKNNARPILNILNQIKNLKPYTFEWKGGSGTDYGFYAHELQSVYPQMVSGTYNEIDDTGQPLYQGVDYSKLTPILTAAIQELTKKVEKLENKFNNLFGKTFILK
jgi:hypothetical protein